MAIYTKKGDGGETRVYGKKFTRISKDSRIIRVLGSVDEVNSYLGVCVSVSNDKEINKFLFVVQQNLLKIGAILAGSNLRFTYLQTKNIEMTVDKLEGELPVLSLFLHPGGSILASHIHYERSLTRKAEREIVGISKHGKVNPQILAYMNCLSDYLFMLARLSNIRSGIEEKTWRR